MKKRDFWIYLGLLAAGLGIILLSLLWETRLSPLFCGIGGGLVGNGVAHLLRYWKWSRPENAGAYAAKLEQEQIDLRDERKEMLRNKAGRYAYLLSMVLCAAAILAVAVLDLLEVLTDGLVLELILVAYLIIQYGAGVWFYRRLEQRW